MSIYVSNKYVELGDVFRLKVSDKKIFVGGK